MPRSRGGDGGGGVCVVVVMLVVIWTTSEVSGEEGIKFSCPPTSKFFFPCNCTGGGEKGLLIDCDNTNLASIAIGLANIRLPIEELRLNKCHIKRLYGDVFQAVNLINLVIVDTPVEEVDDDVFKPVRNSLTVLRFHRAPLTKLPSPALAHLKELKVGDGFFTTFSSIFF